MLFKIYRIRLNLNVNDRFLVSNLNLLTCVTILLILTIAAVSSANCNPNPILTFGAHLPVLIRVVLIKCAAVQYRDSCSSYWIDPFVVVNGENGV